MISYHDVKILYEDNKSDFIYLLSYIVTVQIVSVNWTRYEYETTRTRKSPVMRENNLIKSYQKIKIKVVLPTMKYMCLN